MMENFRCLSCGILVNSYVNYHFHNVTTHSAEELSSTILKVFFHVEESSLASTKLEKNIDSSKVKKNESKKNSGGFRRECMDEVIELGPIEGADNLTVQSLFLKSNYTPNSRHIIEVEEKKQPKNVIKALSEELNAAVVHFQSDYVSGNITDSPTFSKSFKENSDCVPELTSTKKRPKRKVKSGLSKRRKRQGTNPSHRTESKTNSKLEPCFSETWSKSSNTSQTDYKHNVKLVLRSGRTIKTNPKYEDFVYYDDYKENCEKSVLVSSENSRGSSKTSTKNQSKCQKSSTLSDSRELSPSEPPENDPSLPVDRLNTKFLDFFNEELNLNEWNFRNELDISIEDLDLSGFDDLEGSTLPENQILTIENLLQELDGGGSIEISNIIKENNIDSDTVVLDALSHSGNVLPMDSLNELMTKPEGEKLESPDKAPQPLVETKTNYCDICKKFYVNKSHFLRHKEKWHTNSNKVLYRCSSCDKVFVFLAAFEKHVKEHNPNQTFICELCGRVFKNLINLKIHFALHKKEKVYKCLMCPKKYFLKYSFLAHMKTHSSSESFQCHLCLKTFSQKRHFNTHLEKHKNGKYLGWSEDFKCNHCSDVQTAKVLGLIDVHSDYVTCFKCHKGLYKKYLLLNEERSNTANVSDDNRTREQCKVCGKSVKNVKKHIRETHLSNPVMACDICGASIKKASMKAHKHRAHNGVASYCSHCGKTFKNVLALKEHLNKVNKN